MHQKNERTVSRRSVFFCANVNSSRSTRGLFRLSRAKYRGLRVKCIASNEGLTSGVKNRVMKVKVVERKFFVGRRFL